MTFFEQLAARAVGIDSPLCVGLDPRVEPGSGDALGRIVDLNRRIVDRTSPWTLCYKPNIAFYEQHGPDGIEALRRTVALIPDDIPVLLDAKRGDIGATAEAYATACVGLGAGAVTVSPYMGHDSVLPFTQAGLSVFVLCRTSNPGGGDFQLLRVDTGVVGARRDLFLRVAEEVASWPGEIGLVVAGNDVDALREVRRLRPQAWFLAPGIGTQGGEMREAVAAGLRRDATGLLPVVARGIANADDPGAAARRFVEEFRSARDRWRVTRSGSESGGANDSARESRVPADVPGDSVRARLGGSVDLLDAILDTGCFRVGSFTLKSGLVSPFYIDLRRLQSSPAALETAAAAYEAMMRDVDAPCDRLAAIPVAAVSLATALALRVRLPLVYPRLPAKPHGTGNRIEGDWNPGERVVLVDDLITTGLSKLEAIAVLREDGLIVDDLLVLVERGGAGERSGTGRAELAGVGVRVHAAADIRDLVERGVSRRLIAPEDRRRVDRFLEESR